jgi:hypothetical protein
MATRLHATWLPGESHERLLTVGLPRNRHEDATFPWETVVVGAADNLPTAQTFEVMVDQCDDGGLLGPIHLPMCIHVPGARALRVQPKAPVTVKTTIFATTYLADHRGFRSFATWSIVCIPGQVVPLPAGVRAVGSIDPATFVFVDRGGVDLCTPLDSACDRPALAVSVRCVVGGLLMFYY